MMLVEIGSWEQKIKIMQNKKQTKKKNWKKNMYLQHDLTKKEQKLERNRRNCNVKRGRQNGKSVQVRY